MSGSLRFETTVDVEVTEEQLRDNGWLPATGSEGVVSAVERWHIEQHAGAFLWCLEQPCEDVVKASGK